MVAHALIGPDGGKVLPAVVWGEEKQGFLVLPVKSVSTPESACTVLQSAEPIWRAVITRIPVARSQVCVPALHASDGLPGAKTLVEMVEEKYPCWAKMFS